MARDRGLKDEPFDYRLDQYQQKNNVLLSFGEQVSATTLYEDIFDDLDLLMPIIIIDEEESKHVVKMTIQEAISCAEGRNDVLMGGVTYFKEFVSKATAKNIYALIIDMDNVYAGPLLRALQHGWALESGEERPLPTYIVNSGIGLHLYFVFEEPIPCYKRQMTKIDQLYRTLALQQTTGRVYLRKQVQWFGQDFRMAGGCGKDMWENTVFRVGKKWKADDLAKACGLDLSFVFDGEIAPKKNRKKTRPGSQKKKGFTTNRAFYDHALKRCEVETKEGWRYMSMCALTVIAWKCKVPKEELERDLLSLIPLYNKDSLRPIREREVYSAMKMYNDKAIDTPRVRLEDWQGWKYDAPKRNYRQQEVHLRLARGQLAILRELEEVKEGRPKGSGTKEDEVREWQQNNPTGKKIDCHRETGLSRVTINKWWNDEGSR